jgi:hypothetical protein
MKNTMRYLEINSKNFEERGWNMEQSKKYGYHEYPQSLGGKFSTRVTPVHDNSLSQECV